MKQPNRKNKAGQGSRSQAGKKRSSDLWLIAGAAFLVLVVAAIVIAGSRQRERIAAQVVPGEKTKGAASAQVVVEEFADFQCPACRRFYEGPARQLEQEYVKTGKVRFVFRHYAFLGQESRWAAEAAECANEQSRFWDYYDKLFTEQGGENAGVFAKPNLQRFAAELGLDATRFNQCMASGKFAASVQADFTAGANRGVRGTPSVFVNGRLVDRGSDYAILRDAIEQALVGR
jgi:protein-disulfide isomerase